MQYEEELTKKAPKVIIELINFYKLPYSNVLQDALLDAYRQGAIDVITILRKDHQ